MTRVTDSGTLSLLRCTNKACRHHVWRLSDKEYLLPLESELGARLSQGDRMLVELLATSGPAEKVI
jgi:hypothetical protein